MAILRRGGSALDAVEAAARIVEADPRDVSVGRGGWPNILGTVEVDASIMDGRTRRAGAVGAVHGYLYPISIARAVMERLPHVMLVGEGAMRFAEEIGAERARLLTARTRGLWVDFLRQVGETPSSIRRRAKLAPVVMKTVRLERKGTVNFIAIDRAGHMASAVSTSGWGYKYPGRIGDSPIVGAGSYCDERYGGACCTGFGELAMRLLTAKTAVDRLASGVSPDEVARAAIHDSSELDARRLRSSTEGPAAMNVVVLARDGRYASATNKRFASATRRVPRRYAVMTSGMREALVQDRIVVP
jgi:isoaspartyl peptidase/L-asparaginase-like protein (Ntn-hydrolase superfamily)